MSKILSEHQSNTHRISLQILHLDVQSLLTNRPLFAASAFCRKFKVDRPGMQLDVVRDVPDYIDSSSLAIQGAILAY